MLEQANKTFFQRRMRWQEPARYKEVSEGGFFGGVGAIFYTKKGPHKIAR